MSGGVPVLDAGKRASAIVRQAIVDGYAGMWVAVRLSDGGSDGTTYPTKGIAAAFQLHETQCAYIKVPFDTMTEQEATRFMEINRELYEKGFRLSDPDRELMVSDRLESRGFVRYRRRQ